MDYKKLYEKAVERAKTLTNSGFNDFDFVKHIFPELAESEDEKIRKGIIRNLEYLMDRAEGFVKDELKERIAWLEKQKLIQNINKEDEEVRQYLVRIMKQRDINVPMVQKSLNWLEKQGEQNTADKIEPKFRVGDWMIDKQGIVHQIANVVENVTSHTYGYDVVGGGYFNDNADGVRLWTIQDAKDGSVLATKAGDIFIYKELLYDKPFAYCGIDKFGVFKDCNCGDGLDWTPYLSDVTPATKEQCNILEKAMADAGYTFNFEKKELKKIEPKPADKEMKELLRTEYEKGRADAIAEMQKPWSKEDERNLKSIMKIIKEKAFADYDVDEDNNMLGIYGILENWLKSLKDRVQIQPMQEWSEEDSPYYDDICEMLINLLHSETTDVNKGAVQKDLDWFISLKPQSTWKPSDEQMITLRHVISGCSYDIEPLAEMEEQLKKLRGE